MADETHADLEEVGGMSDRYRSAEEVLERCIRDMGEELGRVYNALCTDLTWLHIKWQLYRQLYARSERRIDLLNEAAGHLFGTLQDALLDEVLLSISRLTDRETISGRDNMTVQRLPGLVSAAIRTDVDRLLTEVLDACEPMRRHRHRRLAHRDYATALAIETLTGVSRAQIETAAAALRALFHRIEAHYWESETAFEDVVVPPGDGDALVYYLTQGLRAVAARHARFKAGRPLTEDYTADENIP